MKLYFLTCTLALYFLSFSFFSENHKHINTPAIDPISKVDESSFYYVLDNRYQGGSDAFIELFENNILFLLPRISICTNNNASEVFLLCYCCCQVHHNVCFTVSMTKKLTFLA